MATAEPELDVLGLLTAGECSIDTEPTVPMKLGSIEAKPRDIAVVDTDFRQVTVATKSELVTASRVAIRLLGVRHIAGLQVVRIIGKPVLVVKLQVELEHDIH